MSLINDALKQASRSSKTASAPSGGTAAGLRPAHGSRSGGGKKLVLPLLFFAAALVTVVSTEGSTPQKVGARMLVHGDGRAAVTAAAAALTRELCVQLEVPVPKVEVLAVRPEAHLVLVDARRSVLNADEEHRGLGDADPHWMAMCVVDEAIRNVVAVGADPASLYSASAPLPPAIA